MLRDRRSTRRFSLVVAVMLGAGLSAYPAQIDVPLVVFGRAASVSDREARAALKELSSGWRDSYSSMVLDLAEFSRPSTPAPPTLALGTRAGDPAVALEDTPATLDEEPNRLISPVRNRLLAFLERQTGNRFGHDFDRWHRWIWALPYEPH